mmetsp:Transcript_3031/g.6207  ORF Transcript_3031/g.6207 Transcript_3031/m.6207 type:complete len:253 (-) Transcript_3031:177-935(-)
MKAFCNTRFPTVCATILVVLCLGKDNWEAAALSPLTSTQWRVTLDVGFQPGSWMPKRFPGWGESGARLPLTVEVEFTTAPSTQRESLVGPKDSTYILKVCGDNPTTFVSEKGEQQVTFSDGGWCIQRPTGNIRNTEGSVVRPEGLLRFWLDCPSGAKKRDAEIFPGTRIFITTGVWDDPDGLARMELEYKSIVDELQSVIDQTREIRGEANQSENGTGVLNQLSDFRTLLIIRKTMIDSFPRKRRWKEQLLP